MEEVVAQQNRLNSCFLSKHGVSFISKSTLWLQSGKKDLWPKQSLEFSVGKASNLKKSSSKVADSMEKVRENKRESQYKTTKDNKIMKFSNENLGACKSKDIKRTIRKTGASMAVLRHPWPGLP